MNKQEMISFLETLSEHNLFNKEHQEKFKEIARYIKENTKDTELKKEVKTTSKTNNISELIRNEPFENGKNFEIYTDGGCLVNPGGPGGYGIIILENGLKKSISQGFVSTTNNRMELRGPIRALSEIPEGSNITLYSDSKYFCDAINSKWIDAWLKNDWKKGTVKNIDLWKEFISLYNKHHIEIIWVKGHADNIYNEECDKLATKAYSYSSNLIEDDGFN